MLSSLKPWGGSISEEENILVLEKSGERMAKGGKKVLVLGCFGGDKHSQILIQFQHGGEQGRESNCSIGTNGAEGAQKSNHPSSPKEGVLTNYI